jgi:signal transduction histidine kinase
VAIQLDRVGTSRHASVLIVDDEADVVDSIRELFRLDYRVLGTTSPAEAMMILACEPVDVVMTDQRMPQMTGVELLHRVRHAYPDATRLLVTGYADIRAVIEAINRGNVYRYITKPWDPLELQAILRDAVERHDLLVERQRLIAELEQANGELTRANAELTATSELKSNFIQVASHELRTPLTILVSLAHLANRADGVRQPLAGWLAGMETAVDRMRRRVDDLTSMLVAENFARPLLRRSLDLHGLLEEAADDVRPFLEQRRQRFVRDYGRALGSVAVDAEKIRDVVNHLLLNAIKFTPDAGCITLAALRTSGGAARIGVRDTGSGMDRASRERMFEPFFTAFDVAGHSSGLFEHQGRGLGLGLTVVKAFVEMHGGCVEVESEVGHGTLVTVTLPPARET